MEKPNPATPAQAATPGSVPAVKTQPSSSPASATQNGAQGTEEGKVTITTKEFARLQRADARTRSFEKRLEFSRTPTNANRGANGSAATPEQQALAEAQEGRTQAEQRAMQLEVRDKVRELLAKPELASLPKSTRDLVLLNPSMLSNADNLEEALLDIEDRLLELADSDSGDGIPVTVKSDGGSAARPGPANTETPPTSASGAATPTGNETEDVSKLTGSARTRAMIRNAARAKRAGA